MWYNVGGVLLYQFTTFCVSIVGFRWCLCGEWVYHAVFMGFSGLTWRLRLLESKITG